MPKDESSGAGSKPGKKPFEIPPSSSKSSSLALSDDRIDQMIDPQSTDPMDYPMALFDPVTVNTHEKERKERQTVNTLNDIYKQVSRFDDIFIEPPYDIDLKAQHTLTEERDLSYENIKILLSLYDWFAAAVFDVEACQTIMSEEDMINSSNAISEANTFTRNRFRKLQTIKNELQEKCYVMRTFLQRKTEVADELFKEMGVLNVVNRPPPPKVGKGKAAAAAAAAGAAAAGTAGAATPGAGSEVAAPVAVSWKQAAKSVSEALRRAKADGFFEFIETEDKFKIVLTTLEKQEAKIKDLMATQRALQASIHSLSAHNMQGDGAPAGTERHSQSNKGFKALSEYNDRIVKLLKQSAEHIQFLNGEESADDELLKLIETELSNAPRTLESASGRSLRDDNSRHSSSINENRSSEKIKVGETDTGVKTGHAKIPSTTSATVTNKVAPIPEESKKEKKTAHKNKGKKKEVPGKKKEVPKKK